MATAKLRGVHTRDQWLDLAAHFKWLCVRCLKPCWQQRDHISPVYQGGSDAISNIQPLCSKCNSSKGPEAIDFRPTAAKSLGIKWPAWDFPVCL